MAALALFLQDKTAEDTFKNIQETIEKAKTIRVVFSTQVLLDGEPTKHKASGVLLFAEGNRASISITRPSGTNRTVSDGSEARDFVVTSTGETSKAAVLKPKLDRSGLARILVSSSIVGPGMEEIVKYPGYCGNVYRPPPPEILDFAFGEGDGQAKTLTYTIKGGSPPGSCAFRLWYDPQSLKILKRTVRQTPGNDRVVVSETYNEFTLNADIPAEKFKLPFDK
jgi:outer membrane lipoprotein-sorting protein